MEKRYMLLLSRAGNAIKTHLLNELRSKGINLSIGQMGILFLLEKRDGQTMSELSQSLETDNGAMTRLVDRLEKTGHVTRIPNPEDRRQFLVSITDQGRDEISMAGAVVHATNDDIQKDFSDEEMSIFVRMLISIAEKFR